MLYSKNGFQQQTNAQNGLYCKTLKKVVLKFIKLILGVEVEFMIPVLGSCTYLNRFKKHSRRLSIIAAYHFLQFIFHC
jgi:hypothetical protein